MESSPLADEDPPRVLLAALAMANAVGFMPNTCMPMWVGHLGAALSWPAWTGGALASVQLTCLTLANLIAPRFTATARPSLLGQTAAFTAAGGFLLMAAPVPALVIMGAVASGIGCGWLLASVNSIAACFHNAQRTFAMLQVVLVALGIAWFFTLPRLLMAHGVASVFVILALCALVSAMLARYLPREARGPAASHLVRREAQMRGRALAALFALAAIIGAQTAIMASIMDIGRQIHLSPSGVGTVLSVAAACCLCSPLAARLLGTQVGLVWPLVISTLVLAVAAGWVVHASGAAALLVLTTAVMGLPLFVLPYVLAMLASLGGAGRWAGIAPGFMMAGAALGPAVAGWVRTAGSLSDLGTLVAWVIATAAVVFGLSTPRGKEGSVLLKP